MSDNKTGAGGEGTVGRGVFVGAGGSLDGGRVTDLWRAQRIVRGMAVAADEASIDRLRELTEKLDTTLSKQRWALLLELRDAADRYRKLLQSWNDLNEVDYETEAELRRRAQEVPRRDAGG